MAVAGKDDFKAEVRSSIAPTARRPRKNPLLPSETLPRIRRMNVSLTYSLINSGPRGQGEGELRGGAQGRQGPPFHGVSRAAPRAGAASSASSPAARLGRMDQIHASSSPTSRAAIRARSTRMATAGADRPMVRQARHHIESWKTHRAADRTSRTKATANQPRLFLHAGAYWIMRGLRVSMPKRSMWRVARFDNLRPRLVELAARVVEMKTTIRIRLPTSCPDQNVLRLALARIEAPRRLGNGAPRPRRSNPSRQPANIFRPALWLAASDEELCRRANESGKNHANAPSRDAKRSQGRIIRASYRHGGRCCAFPVDGEREGRARSGGRARDGDGEAGPWPRRR